jgi:electron transfer flavoprotein alpha subunit
MNRDVWVFIEQRDGEIAEVSFELLSKGKKLAGELGGEVKAIVLAHEAENYLLTALFTVPTR